MKPSTLGIPLLVGLAIVVYLAEIDMFLPAEKTQRPELKLSQPQSEPSKPKPSSYRECILDSLMALAWTVQIVVAIILVLASEFFRQVGTYRSLPDRPQWQVLRAEGFPGWKASWKIALQLMNIEAENAVFNQYRALHSL